MYETFIFWFGVYLFIAELAFAHLIAILIKKTLLGYITASDVAAAWLGSRFWFIMYPIRWTMALMYALKS